MDERLGVAGGIVFDVEKGKLNRNRANSLEHVAGGVQLFRRECYDAIGGYMPLKWGGEDFAAEVMARKLGFRTQSFLDVEVLHKRLTGTEEIKNNVRRKVRAGFMDYSIGYSQLYHILKCISKVTEKPFILSAIARQFGYVLAAIKLGKPSIPPDLIRFVRTEQIAKIREKIIGFRVKLT
jgi:poly-beta-1,6-N-acetyl-D-glucosamine synthase